MFDRTPGRGRYAATEREQRWLLARLPEGLTDPVEILDKYLSASTLRLRRAQSGSALVHKLGQKVRHDQARPSITQMTNIYLSQPEFEMLYRLDGDTLSKTRWHWSAKDGAFSVDQFGGDLRGLVLAEIELALECADTPPPPPHAVADVTEDDRFSGGSLASLTPRETEGLLKMIAVMTGVPTPD